MLVCPATGNQAEKDKIAGSTWNSTADDLETFLDVEPWTGVVMNGAQRLQINIKLEKSRMNGIYKNVYTSDGHVMYPIMWIEDQNTIPDDMAAEFVKDVYGNQDLGQTVFLALVIVGALFIVAGLAGLIMAKKVGGASPVGTDENA